MPGDLFTKEALLIQCILGEYQIQLQALLDTGATGIEFIDEAMARHVCEVLQISLIRLASQSR